MRPAHKEMTNSHWASHFLLQLLLLLLITPLHFLQHVFNFILVSKQLCNNRWMTTVTETIVKQFMEDWKTYVLATVPPQKMFCIF